MLVLGYGLPAGLGATNIDSQGSVPGGGNGEPTPEPPRYKLPTQLSPSASIATSPQRLPAAAVPQTSVLPPAILTKPQKVDQIMTAPPMPTPPTDRVDMELGPAPTTPTMPSTAPQLSPEDLARLQAAQAAAQKKRSWWWLALVGGGVVVVGTGVALATRKPKRLRR